MSSNPARERDRGYASESRSSRENDRDRGYKGDLDRDIHRSYRSAHDNDDKYDRYRDSNDTNDMHHSKLSRARNDRYDDDFRSSRDARSREDDRYSREKGHNDKKDSKYGYDQNSRRDDRKDSKYDDYDRKDRDSKKDSKYDDYDRKDRDYRKDDKHSRDDRYYDEYNYNSRKKDKKDRKKEDKHDYYDKRNDTQKAPGDDIIAKNKALSHIPLPIEVFGYYNHNNPFNDESLDKQFIWKKRDQLYLKKNLPVPLRTSAFLKAQALLNKEHIRQAQLRRLELMRNKEERELLIEQMQRDIEASKAQDYELEQSRNSLLLMYKQCEIRSLSRTEMPIHIFIKYILFKMKLTNPDVLLRLNVSTADSRAEHGKHLTFISKSLEIDQMVNIIEVINVLTFDDVVRLYVDIAYILGISQKTIMYQRKIQQQFIVKQDNEQKEGRFQREESIEQKQQQEALLRLAMHGKGTPTGGIEQSMRDTDIIVTEGDIAFWQALLCLISREIDVKYLMKLGFSYQHAYLIILSSTNKSLLSFSKIQNFYKLYLNDKTAEMMRSTIEILQQQATQQQKDPNAAGQFKLYKDLWNISSCVNYIDLNDSDDNKQTTQQVKDLLITHSDHFTTSSVLATAQPAQQSVQQQQQERFKSFLNAKGGSAPQPQTGGGINVNMSKIAQLLGGKANQLSKMDLHKLSEMVREQLLLQKCVPIEWQLETAANIPLYALEDVYNALYYHTNPKNQYFVGLGAGKGSAILAYSDDSSNSMVMSMARIHELKESTKERMKKSQQFYHENMEDGVKKQENEENTDISAQLQKIHEQNEAEDKKLGHIEGLTTFVSTDLHTFAASLDQGDLPQLEPNEEEKRVMAAGSLHIEEILEVISEPSTPSTALMATPQPLVKAEDSSVGISPTHHVKIEQTVAIKKENEALKKERNISQIESDYKLWSGIYHEIQYLEARTALFLYYRRLMLLRAQQLKEEKDLIFKQTDYKIPVIHKEPPARVQLQAQSSGNLEQDALFKEYAQDNEDDYEFNIGDIDGDKPSETTYDDSPRGDKQAPQGLDLKALLSNSKSIVQETNTIKTAIIQQRQHQYTKQQLLLKQQLDRRLQLRKPKFISKVKTGFSWSKYNRSHYDKSNPPPKVVQGYRFHIFYPDLIDPTVAPQYHIITNPSDHDYCTLKFTAGLPYEPIAFKIVRNVWDTERTHGFQTNFSRGVLTLVFNFKRVNYRR